MHDRAIQGRRVLIGAVALGVGSFPVGCGSDETATSASSSPVPSSAPTTEASGRPTTTDLDVPAPTESPTPVGTTVPVETTVPAGRVLVGVYWGWSVLNPAAGSPERIGAGAREVAVDAPLRNGLDAMFAGVNAAEETIGMSTSIPTGARVLGVALDGATAAIDLSAEFETPSGSLDETMRLAQVVFTATQFDGIDRVRITIDGDPRDPILSHGFEVGAGLTRDDFELVRPSILIEQPHPGASVSDPVVIRGESNTFEATLRYAITSGGGDGAVVAEGFATATGGNGIWGSFEVVVDLALIPSGHQPGPGSVVLWEDSPRDGSRLGVVEIPITLPER